MHFDIGVPRQENFKHFGKDSLKRQLSLPARPQGILRKGIFKQKSHHEEDHVKFDAKFEAQTTTEDKPKKAKYLQKEHHPKVMTETEIKQLSRSNSLDKI